jgi:formylglycine-generating enzyme required for sulfatase activity
MKIGALVLLLASLCHLLAADPVSSAFSYQGRLQEGGAPANGHFDLSFGLFTSETGGTPSVPVVTNQAVVVTDGLFTVILDFGSDVFSGAQFWLEIKVRPAGITGDFTTLRPRQPLTPAPYALYTLKAESIHGPIKDSQLPPNIARLDGDQTFIGPVRFNQGISVQGTLSGDGAGLSNVVATALSARAVERLWRVSIPFVTVTNAGNAANADGKGGVAYPFKIGKYEINNNQYVAFLNAIAAADPNGTWTSNMTVNVHGGIERSGTPGEYSYTVKPGMGHRPVVWVDFYDVLRFCNWLHNGQPTGAQDATTTEDGAYTLEPAAMLANTITRNPQARFWLPSDNEWYKAAYHQPAAAGGDPSGYWMYPTQSNEVPFSEPPPGFLNSVNSCCDAGRSATDVGSYVDSVSYYGTFDQGGNVQEWTEEILYITNRRLRGGSWVYNEFYTSANSLEFDTTDYPAEGIGFRVAGAVEP